MLITAAQTDWNERCPLSERRRGILSERHSLELFIEDYTIADWPWEYIYDRKNDQFLSMGPHPISRGIFTFEPADDLKLTKDKVCLLIAVAASSDDKQIKPEEEIKSIKQIFESFLGADFIEIKIVKAENPSDIHQELQKRTYHILHFIGHAGFDYVQNCGYLEFNKGKYYINTLSYLFRSTKLRIVFLNACKTANSGGSETPINSVAGAIFKQGIPAVIGTQFNMPDVSAHFLSSTIYNSLLTGSTVTKAVSQGRISMSYSNGSKFFDWGIPVLFSSAPNLVIFPIRKANKMSESDSMSWRIKNMKTLIKVPIGNTRFGVNSPSISAPMDLVLPAVAGVLPAMTNQINVPSSSEKMTDESLQNNIRVALIDIDSKVGFLPDLIAEVNKAQSYYSFIIAYYPIPSCAIKEKTIEDGKVLLPQLFVTSLEEYFDHTDKELNVDIVCCLTKNMIAFERDDFVHYNHFSIELHCNKHVSFISTYNLREYASEAGTTFAKATLYLLLPYIIGVKDGLDIDFHDETLGCIFDECVNRNDIIEGLRKMKFDHRDCRNKIKNSKELEAIDKILSIPAI